MSETIETLKQKRGQVKGSLTRFKNYLTAINKEDFNNDTIKELQRRVGQVEPLLERFESIQYEIECQLSEITENEEKERNEFENVYFSSLGKADSLISQFYKPSRPLLDSGNQSQASLPHSSVSVNNFNASMQSIINNDSINNAQINNNENVNIHSTMQIKFPPIKLPDFNGSYNKWLEFRDTFTALVHGNQRMSNIEKFYYLKSSLQDQALEIIESMEVTATNYQIAWSLITERFENKRLIVFNHIKSIFEFPIVQKENHFELRKLYDTITRNLRSLKSLNEPTESWDTLIIYLITCKLDPTSRRDWETFDVNNDMPSMIDMNKFLKNKCELLEKLEYNLKQKENKSTDNHYKKSKKEHSSSHVNVDKHKCYFCSGPHSIYYCEKLLAYQPGQRKAEITKRNLCLNCFRPGHTAEACKCSTCKKCSRKHNTLIHIDYSSDSNRQVSNESSNNISQTVQTESKVTTANVTSSCSAQVLLATAVIQIKDTLGKFHRARALLDNGSMSNFITEELCNTLNLPRARVNYSVKGVGQALANISNQTTIQFKSCTGEFNSTISCLIIPKITDSLPNNSFNSTELELPPGIQLADCAFNKRNKIDILLGASIFWELFTSEQIKLGKNKPYLQKTHLGWIISGNLSNFTAPGSSSTTCFSIQLDNQLNDNLMKFWQLEECQGSKQVLSGSDRFCEEHFKQNLKRNEQNQFIVKIPLNDKFDQLGRSQETALKRFYSLEKKLNNDDNLKSQYVEFMREYVELGHMSIINQDVSDDCKSFYLPHHAVIKESSRTTKTRVVFDASAKTDSGLSLNDVQYSGPTIQSELFSILVRFRQYPYVLSADISKMYRQVLIDDNQRSLQKIFWRECTQDPLQCYQLNTVTYGTSSAPWLAIRSMVQLAFDNELAFPKASKVIISDFYVDDLLTGSDTIEELLEIQRDVTAILSTAGFHLRKWLTNKAGISDQFQINKELSVGILHLGEDENNKTLGLLWNSNSDTIQYSIQSIPNNAKVNVTKRFILSTISQIYDPLGLLGPIVIRAKLILQELWRACLAWDEPVPKAILKSWNEFYDDLQNLNALKISRWALSSKPMIIELHGFCDASESAYGACIYVRCKDSTGVLSCHLLCAKSRVAPVKQISLPRLELCGAHLLAQLVIKVKESITLPISEVYLWTDSTVTLGWIRGQPKNWKTFVANRVGDIQNLTDPKVWRHVTSKDNPADLLSRGINAQNILKSDFWFHGPQFLLSDTEFSSHVPCVDEMPEKRVVAAQCTISDKWDLFDRFSSLTKLQRVFSWMLRFINNSRSPKKDRQSGYLTSSEYNTALTILVSISQRDSFLLEYKELLKGQCMIKKGPLSNLNPFLDNNKILRVGGRISNSEYNYNKVHPAILSPRHKLTILILQNEHIKLFHCGPQHLLASIRERFWPIGGRNAARKITRNCIVCFKVKPIAGQYLMGNLPSERVSQFSPFHNVGLDYAGPILIKDRKLRGAKLIKSYVVLFVCMSIKAVHLDLVTELSTDCFLQVLKRFVARRGKPKNIYSDNGTQFVGAGARLKEWFDFLNEASSSIANCLLEDNITWHFIPARSPNFGGLWEAGIKSMKFHLKRVVGTLHLTYEDMLTVLAQVESILNSRPLTPLSSNPNDMSPLTPAHFIIGKSLTALPEADLSHLSSSKLKKFDLMQRAITHFWNRWQREYIAELQLRTKGKSDYPSLLKIDSLVIIKDDEQPSLRWKLGRVVKLHPGKDNVVRVASVRLPNGNEVQRVISKLCVLPIEKD